MVVTVARLIANYSASSGVKSIAEFQAIWTVKAESTEAVRDAVVLVDAVVMRSWLEEAVDNDCSEQASLQSVWAEGLLHLCEALTEDERW